VPVDLVVDHSVQVDFAGSAQALKLNMDMEFTRNRERYEFLKWGQQAFKTFGLVPPGIGIVHQVNLEYLAKGVLATSAQIGGQSARVYYPDTLVGTDSHTTMINGLGVVGWGVGGIEAEAGMLGQPVYFLTPGSRRRASHRVVARRRHRDRSRAAHHADAARAESRRQSLSSSTAPARPRCRWLIARRSATWRPSTAPRWASSPSITNPSPTSAHRPHRRAMRRV
jgi:hypothetical protein